MISKLMSFLAKSRIGLLLDEWTAAIEGKQDTASGPCNHFFWAVVYVELVAQSTTFEFFESWIFDFHASPTVGEYWLPVSKVN